jgi:3-hydroxyacyl-CoA dehydrogenase
MSDSPLLVRRAAVLGAGVMGAQIAAQLANSGVPVLLFDLRDAGDPNKLARAAIDHLARLEPAPLALKERASAITPANYDDDVARIADCDLVIEAIAERMDWKRELYARIAAHVGGDTVIASNTSGLSIRELAGALPEELVPHFCGMHFFNPPRYMHLVELVPGPATPPGLLDRVETFLTTMLGKGVIRAKDTPNFIANRIGIFSVLATMRHAERLGLGFDAVDAVTGTALGRAKSATYRTADIVGLDTLAHVVRTMHEQLPDDPWHASFAMPAMLDALLARQALGQKSGTGFYRKRGSAIEVLDAATGDYRPADAALAPEVAALLAQRDAGERLASLRHAAHPQAELVWCILRDVFHYAAFHLEHIADNVRDVDLALRWGFGWREGPFETWQAAGWKGVAEWMAQDVAAGKALAPVPLPAWCTSGPAREGPYHDGNAWSPAARAFVPRSALPVYRRQFLPDAVPGERRNMGTTVFETNALRLWHLEHDVAIATFKTRAHTISAEVLDGLHEAVARAEHGMRGLVLWHPDEPFSLGADLKSVAPLATAGRWGEVEDVVARFQETSQRLRYCLVPTVAAVRGMALGGACEFILHCDRTVAALESYIGLVEAGVGLVPAGGGCKELALRAAHDAQRGAAGGQLDQFPFVRTAFETVARATVAKSALDAKALGFLRPADIIVPHPHELLHVAIEQARALAEGAYRPPLPPAGIPVAGRTGVANLEMLLVNLREGGFVSAYDFEVGLAIARALCGGDVEPGSVVDERWLLEQERRAFMTLVQDPRTQQRIAHTLATGKPLRN